MARKKNNLSQILEQFSLKATKATGTSISFILALSVIIVWGLTGPLFHFSDTWQLVIEVKVYLYGNTAVVTVLSTWRGKENNQEYSSKFQATHVWVKQEGRWQLVAAHVSPVKK
jgi:Low affinity iron permease/Domain of unknown function (DUF4440)